MIETPNLKLKIPEPTDATDNPYYIKDGFTKIDTAVTELGTGKAEANHSHNEYVPKTGGTFTGNVTVPKIVFPDYETPVSGSQLLVYRGDVKALGYTQLSQCTKNGIYLLNEVSTLTDYPQALKDGAFVYGTMLVAIAAQYNLKIITATRGYGDVSVMAFAWNDHWNVVLDNKQTCYVSTAVPTSYLGDGLQWQTYS